MHAHLPTWLRGSFVIRRDGPAAGLVRRDFLAEFDRLGLLRAGRDDFGDFEDEDPAGRGAGRGPVRVAPAGALGRAVVRPFRRGGLPGRFVRRRYALGNRAFDELVLTERLRWRGVPVAEPLAAVQERCRPGYVALLVTRHLPEAVPLSDALRERPGDPAELMRAAGRAVRRLHEEGGWHADLNASNLLVEPDGPGPRVTILDLDRGRLLGAPLPAPLARRNLRRLRRSLRKLGLAGALAAWPAFREGYDEPTP